MGKRNSQLQELTVVAQNDYLTIVDTSAGQSKRVSVKTLVGNVDLGWVATGESWTFSSWSSTTRIAVITVPSDATTKYTPGMRVRFSQTTGGTKYGIIVAVTSTTVTVFLPSGTSLINETITSPVYSSIKAPYGFNLNPEIWSLSASFSNNRTLTDQVNFTSLIDSMVVGVGAWRVSYRLDMRVISSSSTAKRGFITLSTSGADETDQELTSTLYTPTGTNLIGSSTFVAVKDLTFTTQKTLLFMGKTSSTSAQVQLDSGTTLPAYIRATSAYL